MNDSIKDRIEEALKAMPADDFMAATQNLLNALGYESTKKIPLSGDVDAFLDALSPPPSPNTQSEETFRCNAASAHIIFQLTDEEIAAGASGQQRLFATGDFDKGNIKSFLFVAVELTGTDYSRSEYALFTREINKRLPMPTVVLFKTANDLLSLAFVHRRENKRNPERDVLGSVALVRQIDLDLDDTHPAHLKILDDLALEERLRWMDLNGHPTNFDGLLVAWLDALDTEELNRRFYQDLFNWFERAIREATFPNSQKRTLPPEEHVIRLITRLLFIWFIKEKELIAEELFIEEQIRRLLKNYDHDEGDSYYRAVLQNLFFATLNTEIGKRGFSKVSNTTHRDFSRYRYDKEMSDSGALCRFFDQTPFINGGLFDCLDSEEATGDGGYRIDCFSDNPSHRNLLSIPNRLFFDDKGLIPLFNHYKFTVEENTPAEREVALDPELLGKVFENLLAAVDPETSETARKQTGSYYTPRPVVDYMVDEALVETLASKIQPIDGDGKFWRERLHYLLDYNDANELFRPEETKSLIRAIAKIKILDPAVGSGAFPMGVLHKLTLALRRLDPKNKQWEKLQKELAVQRATTAFDSRNQPEREAKLKEISDTFERYRDSDFGRKLYLIQNSIFGVDIQSIACQIAKLRFFISLAIEQEPNSDQDDNFGIQPLPNLETRFVAANTLLRLEDADQLDLFRQQIDVLKTKLAENRERHFHAATRQKKLACRKEDKKLRESLAMELQSAGLPQDDANQIAHWDPYDQNARADWFDAEYMFGPTGRFDVVIGNPPYVVSKDKQLRKIYNESVYGRPNLYGYFIHRVLSDLLENNGILIFINPRTLLTDSYCSALRTFVLKHSQIRSVLNIVDRRNVFESVLQSCIVNSFQNTNTIAPIKVKSILKKEDISDKGWIEVSQEDFLYYQNNIPLFIVGNSYQVYEIFRKLRKLKSLKEHSLSFTTGKIQWDLYKSVLGDIPLPIATRLIWAENVQRYCYSEARKRTDRIYINERLERHQPITHDTIIVQRTTAVEQERRIIAHLFLPDTFGYPIQAENHTSYLITQNKDVSLKFVLGILNSKFTDFIFRHINSNTQVSAGELNSLKFPDSENLSQHPIINLVDYIIYLKQQPGTDGKNLSHARDYLMVKYFEQIIDGLVYELYLTDELHSAGRYFSKPLLDKELPSIEDMADDKMPALRDIFERLFDKKHPVRKNLFFLDSLEIIRIIEGKT